MVDLSIEMKGLEALQRKLQKLPSQIAKAESKALQRSGRKARDAAREEAERVFNEPKPTTIKAIENRWSSFKAVQAGKAEAAVYIKSFLVDEIYPQVFRVRETSLPKSSSNIIEPAKKTRLNKHGNIPGLRTGAVTRKRRNRDKFLEVPIGNTNPATKHLLPGLYQIQGGKNRGRRRTRQKLKAVYFYRQSRTYENKFKNYREVVATAFKESYREEFYRALTDELAKR